MTNFHDMYGNPKNKNEIIYEIALSICKRGEPITELTIKEATESYEAFVKCGIISEEDEIDTWIKSTYPEDGGLINSKILDVYEKKGIYTKTFLGENAKK